MLRTVKESLKLASRWVTLPIKDGPLKGMQWIACSGSNFLRGTYELDKTRAVMQTVLQGETVWDIGGHVGYYAIIESTLVGDSGQVLVFEPRPLNIAYIKRHIAINRIGNITVVPSAVSDQPGAARFETRTGTGTGHLSRRGNLEVNMVAVDILIDREGYPIPDFIKMDVEGAEIKALNGAMKTIKKHRPKMLVATHGKKEHQYVMDLLNSLDYQIEVLDNRGKGDTEVLAVPES